VSRPPASPCVYPPPIDAGRLLTQDELDASLEATLAGWDGASDLWIFGYGSLIWNPQVPTLESLRARVYGFHRGLYLWSRVNRGTPEQPGLVLALDRGGSCAGMALRLAGAGARAHFAALWHREMPMGSYRPTWAACTLADGRQIRALTFVIRREASAYTGRLSDATLRTVLGCASGRYGTTLEYVRRTADALRAHGMPDRTLEALLVRCG
jgi:glutathione-specific gamma-glutamylcyclotransferase